RLEGSLHDGKNAFRFNIPSSLIRLQRRENYRIRTPRTSVHIPLEGEAGEQRSVITYMYDISVGGICMLDELMQLDDAYGRLYENCRITLSDRSVIVANLLVRNSQESTLPNGRKFRRIGCQFEGMSNQTRVNVQRYITNLEREQNARGMGM
ncbi:MAG: PilZ domain-containing protein, partial [Burkholderiaceae bacterium]|nr:PilZ domain-containing protein [Burkholderiaceae bacterium]